MRYRSRGSKASFPAAFAGLCLLVFATGAAGAVDHGVIHGHTYETFSEAQGILGGAIQTTHRDRAGRLWAGGYLGLFRLEGQAFVAVGRDDLGGR